MDDTFVDSDDDQPEQPKATRVLEIRPSGHQADKGKRPAPPFLGRSKPSVRTGGKFKIHNGDGAAEARRTTGSRSEDETDSDDDIPLSSATGLETSKTVGSIPAARREAMQRRLAFGDTEAPTMQPEIPPASRTQGPAPSSRPKPRRFRCSERSSTL